MGWQDVPVVEKGAGGWQDAPIVDQEKAKEKPKEKGVKLLPDQLGGLEPLATMASQAFAVPAGAVAGFRGAAKGYSAKPGTPEAAADYPTKERERVQREYTYEPKTEAGKSNWNPLNFIP